MEPQWCDMYYLKLRRLLLAMLDYSSLCTNISPSAFFGCIITLSLLVSIHTSHSRLHNTFHIHPFVTAADPKLWVIIAKSRTPSVFRFSYVAYGPRPGHSTSTHFVDL